MHHSTILCVTQPSYASLNHLIRHSTILSVTQQFCQDVDFINKFDTIWSSKWLWSIIFFSESGYLDDRTFQHMHVTVKALNDLHVFAHWRYIWICWFGCCAFVKPSSPHLQTSDINASFGTSLDFSQNNLFIFQLQLSAFADMWYIHICQRWYHGCFLHCSSIGIHSSNPFSPSPSYRVMDGDG